MTTRSVGSIPWSTSSAFPKSRPIVIFLRVIRLSGPTTAAIVPSGRNRSALIGRERRWPATLTSKWTSAYDPATFPETVTIGCPNLSARYISYVANGQERPAMQRLRTREPAGIFQIGDANCEGKTHELRKLGEWAELVTGVTTSCVVYHRRK